MIFGDHHPPLWLKDHPHVFAPRKVASSRGKRIVLIGTPIAKKGQSGRSKKRESSSRDSPTQASKKKKTAAARVGGSKGVVIQEAAIQDPLPMEESAAQGGSTPVSKRPVRKTRAGRKTSIAPTSSSLPTSAIERKSTQGIVYSERRVSVSTFALLLINRYAFPMILTWFLFLDSPNKELTHFTTCHL
jgi:hypothetical protein